MDLGVLVAPPPLPLLHAAALDSEQDDDDGGEETHYHCGHPDGDEIFLLKSLLVPQSANFVKRIQKVG